MYKNILRAEGNCPYCGAKILFYYDKEWRYGSPVRNCKKCGKKYVDERYHEIVVEGIEPGALSIKRNGIGMLIMLGIFLVSFLIHFYQVNQKSTYDLTFCAFMVIALLGILLFVIDSIRILTGTKVKKLERLREQSVKRLQNWSYAKELEALGYPVPEEYL